MMSTKHCPLTKEDEDRTTTKIQEIKLTKIIRNTRVKQRTMPYPDDALQTPAPTGDKKALITVRCIERGEEYRAILNFL